MVFVNLIRRQKNKSTDLMNITVFIYKILASIISLTVSMLFKSVGKDFFLLLIYLQFRIKQLLCRIEDKMHLFLRFFSFCQANIKRPNLKNQAFCRHTSTPIHSQSFHHSMVGQIALCSGITIYKVIDRFLYLFFKFCRLKNI